MKMRTVARKRPFQVSYMYVLGKQVKLTDLEPVEQFAGTKLLVQGGCAASTSFLGLASTESEVAPDAEEENHGDDLRDQTNNHDLHTPIGARFVVGDRSKRSSNCLKN